MTLDEFIKKIPSLQLEQVPKVHIFGIGSYSSSGITQAYNDEQVKRVEYDFKNNTLTIHIF